MNTTKNAQHTPGPWRIDGITRFGNRTIAAGDSVKTCEFIAAVQEEANARLIAAAPELLDALKAVVAALSQPCWTISLQDFDENRLYNLAHILKGDASFAVDTARVAIAKATGQP